MSDSFPFVDGQGRRFRVERIGDRKYKILAKDGDEEELVGSLQHCDSETIAARIHQFITSDRGGGLIQALGPIVATESVNDWAESDDDRKGEMCLCLIRHLGGDWGEVRETVREANNLNSLTGEGHLLSEYTIDGRSIRIGTGMRSDNGERATVVFFSEEAGTEVKGSSWVT